MRKLIPLIALLLIPQIVSAAIALDTSGGAAIAASPVSASVTTAGTNLEMVVCAYQPAVSATATSMGYWKSGVGTAFTKETTSLSDSGTNDYSTTMWAGAVASTTGGTLYATTSSGTVGLGYIVYSGVAGGIDQATTTNTGASFSYAGTVNLYFTLAFSNEWSVECGSDGGSSPAASTNFTSRVTTVGATIMGDSNGTITNPFTMKYTFTGGTLPAQGLGVTLNPNSGAAASTFDANDWWALFW